MLLLPWVFGFDQGDLMKFPSKISSAGDVWPSKLSQRFKNQPGRRKRVVSTTFIQDIYISLPTWKHSSNVISIILSTFVWEKNKGALNSTIAENL